MSGSEGPGGMGFLNRLLGMIGGRGTQTRRTFVVLGCPRGGTSLVAGALHTAGVYMGNLGNYYQYEDRDFKIPPKQADQALETLAPIIRRRNRKYPYWGWKLPNNIYYIEQVRHLLVEPCYLFIYRDPLRIAQSSARHDQRDWSAVGDRLLEVAHEHTRRVRQFQDSLSSESPVPDLHEFHLEAIHANPQSFVDQLIAILDPLRPDRERLLGFINRDGDYHAPTLIEYLIAKIRSLYHRRVLGRDTNR